jgi:FAS-associated factor 2
MALKQEQEIASAKWKEELQMNWHHWTHKSIVAPLATSNRSLRIAICLAMGMCLVQSFVPTTSLTALYAYVDSQLILLHFELKNNPCTAPEGTEIGEKALESQIHATGSARKWWGFQLATAYPRSKSEIPWKQGVHLGDLSMLKGGRQIVVEMLG